MDQYLLNNLSGMVDFLVSKLGSLGIFLGMILESANIPLPSEMIMPLGGYLAAIGLLSFWKVIAVGTLGNVFGSIISYGIGFHSGRSFLKKNMKNKFFSENHLRTAEGWFKRHGEITVLLGRMIPIVRTFISLPAGIAQMNFWKFILYSAIGSLPWNWLLTYLGYQFGQNLGGLKPYFHDLNYVILAIIMLGGLYLFLKKRKRTNMSK